MVHEYGTEITLSEIRDSIASRMQVKSSAVKILSIDEPHFKTRIVSCIVSGIHNLTLQFSRRDYGQHSSHWKSWIL
jgi:hypothetical protein